MHYAQVKGILSATNGMNLYRAFRGAEPDKTPLLKARGLLADTNADIQSVEGDTGSIDNNNNEVEF